MALSVGPNITGPILEYIIHTIIIHYHKLQHYNNKWYKLPYNIIQAAK